MIKNNKKGAIELSLNFLVIIIISIVLLGFGITFAAKLFKGAVEKKAEVDKATQERIEELLSSSGDLVIVPITKKEISPGDSDVFGLGIKNIGTSSPNFDVNVDAGSAVDRNGDEILNWYNADWKLVKQENPITINPNEREVVPILVGVPKTAADGTYSFTIKVTNAGQPYGRIKIFVEVS